MLLLFSIVFLFIGGAVSVDQITQLSVDILENGGIFRQRTTFVGNDLQIIEMPQHNQFDATITYLDFKNEFELTKYTKNQYCQLSKLDVTITPKLEKLPQQRQAPGDTLDLREMKKNFLVKLQSDEAMSNTSFLRSELQTACHDLPIYWTETVKEDVFQQYKFQIDENKFVSESPNARSIDEWQCEYRPFPVPEPSKSFCSNDCRYQVCGPYIGASCYYYVHCKEDEPIGSSCYNHVTNHASTCRLCCADPRYGCAADGWTLVQHCRCF